MLPVRQETPDMNTVRMPFKRETNDKTFPQNVLSLQRLAKHFGVGYAVSLTFQNILELDIAYP
jgi:hypothetical protein